MPVEPLSKDSVDSQQELPPDIEETLGSGESCPADMLHPLLRMMGRVLT